MSDKIQASGNYPQLPISERDRRWRLIREYMAKERLDALIVYGADTFFGLGMSNIRYFTSVADLQGSLFIFPLEGEPVLFSSPWHMNVPFSPYSKAQEWVKDIRHYDGPANCFSEIKARGLDRGSLGLMGFGSYLVVGSTIPYTLYKDFEKTLPDAKIRDVTWDIVPFRTIKSQPEIEMLCKAAELALKTVQQMWETANPGVAENKVWADMMRAQIVNGGEPHAFILLSSGPVDDSKKYNLLHPMAPSFSPQKRTLQQGDLLITEFHTNYSGYLGCAEFSMVLGHAPKELQRIHDVSVECFYRYFEVMKAGTTLREVWEAVRKPCLDAGMDYVELGFHGHGLSSPDWPAVVYKPGRGHADGAGLADVVLQENMVFGTNIDIHDPRWSKHIGHMLGDMVVITKKGGKRIVNTPTDRFVKK